MLGRAGGEGTLWETGPRSRCSLSLGCSGLKSRQRESPVASPGSCAHPWACWERGFVPHWTIEVLFQVQGARMLGRQKPQGLQQALRSPEAPVNRPLSHCQHFLRFLSTCAFDPHCPQILTLSRCCVGMPARAAVQGLPGGYLCHCHPSPPNRSPASSPEPVSSASAASP